MHYFNVIVACHCHCHPYFHSGGDASFRAANAWVPDTILHASALGHQVFWLQKEKARDQDGRAQEKLNGCRQPLGCPSANYDAVPAAISGSQIGGMSLT
jgi:hypothetical protein